MQSEAPLTLILSPLRAGRGGRTRFGSLFGAGHGATAGSPLHLEDLFSVRLGSAPASGAANRALAVGTVRCPEPSDRDCLADVFREGAEDSRRGACAPHALGSLGTL